MTPDDRRGEIDRRFDETFAVFDERMRKEQETISQERAGRVGTTGGGAAGEGELEGGGGDRAGASGMPGGGEEAGQGGEGSDTGQDGTGGDGSSPGEGGEAQGSGTQGGGGGVGGGGPKGGSGPSGVPSDVMDGSDDDIVARQLREAAMKETDPELRERLWDEYRKYKQGTP